MAATRRSSRLAIKVRAARGCGVVLKAQGVGLVHRLQEGDRVKVGRHLGVVRYVGTVDVRAVLVCHCVATLLTPRAFSPYERAASSALASGLASNSTPLMASMMAV